MGVDLTRMHDAQAQALVETTRLANELGKPASQRDAAVVMAGWQRIDRMRRAMNMIFRQAAKGDRDDKSPANSERRAASRYIRHFRARMNYWDTMADCIARHVAASDTPLELYRSENASDEMLTLLADALHKVANTNAQSEAQKDEGMFADIPLPVQSFDQLMLVAYRLLVARGRSMGARFMDVGCGGGTKVLAASPYFSHSVGLEYDPAYVRAAQKLLGLVASETCEVLEGDALTFEGYGAYDVIYFYRPLRDDARLRQMEARIIEQADPGTIIIAPYNTALAPHQGWTCAQVIAPIFITGLAQAQVDVWHEDAVRTAPDRVKRPADMHFQTGFWTPLLEVAHYNGA
jgi:SAM-dependent methyltransferase